MPFRSTFECLWCGSSHAVRGPDDLEGWAHLCSTCLGRAGENGFLRMRLKAALGERASATTEPAAPDDDWYLRRGRHSRGPVHDLAWQVDLDAATVWLDELPLGGEIVELAAGAGWWSPLLAGKGELSVYDAVGALLDQARRRLLAHGLRAHLHVRDPWTEPDRTVDALFTGFWLGRQPRERLAGALLLARRWLRPGGTFAFVDSWPDPRSGVTEGSAPRSSSLVWGPAGLEAALLAAGFEAASVTTTSRFFLLARATA